MRILCQPCEFYLIPRVVSLYQVWTDQSNIIISEGGKNLKPETAGQGWGTIGAVATEAITGETDIIGIQFQCDDKADAMLGLNADHSDSSWQDLDYYFYCHPLSRAASAGNSGTLVYYSDPSSGPEDVNLGVYTADDVFQLVINDAGKLVYTM